MSRRDELLEPGTEPEKWPEGPWTSEPSRIEWLSAQGFPALMVRNPIGAWCGYIAVAKGHPWYGLDWCDVPADIHGGCTYAEPCQGHVCDTPPSGQTDDVWWIGFDCAHGGDAIPGFEALAVDGIIRSGAFTRSSGCVYWTASMVRDEVERLASQARDAANTG